MGITNKPVFINYSINLKKKENLWKKGIKYIIQRRWKLKRNKKCWMKKKPKKVWFLTDEFLSALFMLMKAILKINLMNLGEILDLFTSN